MVLRVRLHYLHFIYFDVLQFSGCYLGCGQIINKMLSPSHDALLPMQAGRVSIRYRF